MLGTRTKQVYAYGRRGHRIVNVTDDREQTEEKIDGPPKPTTSRPIWKNRHQNVRISSLARHEHNAHAIESPSSSSKRRILQAKHTVQTKKSYKFRAVKADLFDVLTPRKPLSTVTSNVSSPRVASRVQSKHKDSNGVSKSKTTPIKPLVPISPVVQMDIVVLDRTGRKLSQEHRVSRPNVQANPLADTKQARVGSVGIPGSSPHDAIVLSDAEDIDPPRLKKPNRGGRARPIVISSDEETDVENKSPRIPLSSQKRNDFPPGPSSKVSNGKDQKPGTAIHYHSSPEPTKNVLPQTSLEALQRRPQPRSSLAATTKPLIATHAQDHARIKSQSRSGLPAPLLSPRASRRSTGDRYNYVSRHQFTPTQRVYGRESVIRQSSPSSDEEAEDDVDVDFDNLELELSQLGLNSSDLLTAHDAPPPLHLQPLLAECGQTAPHDFSTFIKMFPRDPLVRTHYDQRQAKAAENAANIPTFRKVGEASYSEVFGISDVVLKVIPIRDESAGRRREEEEDGPAPSDAKDVLKEIIVTRAMGELCTGFVELLRTYVVRGKYPSVLLDLWDEYEERKGSESVRPDTFTVSQVYTIIVLPNGGPDLEAYVFPTAANAAKSRTASPWRQACSVFWQVARTLATAEDLVRFEHRDLHWGQILVKSTSEVVIYSQKGKGKIPMDHDAHGVQVTVIDLGLARMDSSAGKGVHWTPFDDEVFEGEGDYQFDIYRMMRTHIGSARGAKWDVYRPLTNVMWLHYLAQKLLAAKRLRAPSANTTASHKPATSTTFTERECYECLVEIERALQDVVASMKKSGKGRRKNEVVKSTADHAINSGLKNAAEVLAYGVARGWILAEEDEI